MSDPFRAQYRQLNADEAAAIARVNALAGDLYRAIAALPAGRHQSLAQTNLEQSVMWAVKAVTG